MNISTMSNFCINDNCKRRLGKIAKKIKQEKNENYYYLLIIISIVIIACVMFAISLYFKNFSFFEDQLGAFNSNNLDTITSHSRYQRGFSREENNYFDKMTDSQLSKIFNYTLQEIKVIEKINFTKLSTLKNLQWSNDYIKSFKKGLSTYDLSVNTITSEMLSEMLGEKLYFQSGKKIAMAFPANQLFLCNYNKQDRKNNIDIANDLAYMKLVGLDEEACVITNPNRIKLNRPCYLNCTKHKISSYYRVKGENNTKEEILNNGPVILKIPVYNSFLTYSEGEYSISKEKEFYSGLNIPKLGNSFVKIIGWTNDNWIIQNYFGNKWGQNGMGLIKIEENFTDEIITFITNDSNLNKEFLTRVDSKKPLLVNEMLE